MLNEHDGWIYNLYQDNMLEPDFWSYYTAAVYWIITTFTSVGYGEIRGYTINENVFQIVLMMIGIAFYGYMIGIFQTLFSEMESTSQFDE
jgi:voltage-gated potassium channel